MAKAIETRFGLTIEVNRDIPKSKYVALQKEIATSLTAANLDPKKVKVYIHHISLRAAKDLLRAGSISKRMERLFIKLTIPTRAQKQKQMKFLNHELGVVYQKEVEMNSRDYSVQYLLNGHYCETHTDFDDYLALLVEDTCPENLKNLTMSITAFATPAFVQKWINDKSGIANTKLTFSLSRDIQLTF